MARKSRVTIDFHSRELEHAVVEAASVGGSNSPLEKCAALVKAEAVRSMRGGGGKSKTPSEPGTPPNVQSGNLRGAITYAMVTGTNKVIVGPEASAWYGKIHEHGNPASHHPKRPFMRPALYEAIDRFPDCFRDMKLASTRMGRWLMRQSRKRRR